MAKGDMGSAMGSATGSAGSALASGPSRMFRPTGPTNYMMPQQPFSNGQMINQSGQSSPMANGGSYPTLPTRFNSPMGNVGYLQGPNGSTLSPNYNIPQSPMMPSQNAWASILQKMMGNSGFTGLAQSNPPQSMYGLFGNGMIK